MSATKNKSLNFNTAVRNLNNGNVIIVPTDTIPGLAVDGTNTEAINKVYEIKRRDKSKTLPLLFSSIPQVEKYFELSKEEQVLTQKFWPGGLTLVLKPRNGVVASLMNHAGKVGVRIPNNRTTISLIRILEKPIAATSVNIAGETSIIKLEQIPASITSQIAGILTGNYESNGKPSTVAEVSKNGLKVYREGAISTIEILHVLKSALNRKIRLV